MKRKVAFMYIIGDIGNNVTIKEEEFENVIMMFVGVGSYDMASKTALKLKDEGVGAIELCAGFGIQGHALIKEAVNSEIPIGAVRYDVYPGYGNISGDEKWIGK